MFFKFLNFIFLDQKQVLIINFFNLTQLIFNADVLSVIIQKVEFGFHGEVAVEDEFLCLVKGLWFVVRFLELSLVDSLLVEIEFFVLLDLLAYEEVLFHALQHDHEDDGAGFNEGEGVEDEFLAHVAEKASQRLDVGVFVFGEDELGRKVWVDQHDAVDDMVVALFGDVLGRFLEVFVDGVEQQAEVVFLLGTGVW